MINKFTTSSGIDIPIIIEKRRGMRNICIRPKTMPAHEIHISTPWFVSRGSALAFLEQKRKWVEKIFTNAPIKSKICDGDMINIFGIPTVIRHNPTGRGGVYMDNADVLTMVVCGAPEMLERRARDFIKSEFLGRVKAIIKTVPVEFHPSKITIRDTTSRWGSCSSTRAISFSYRLSFAPAEVMRYVILHELAHLKHLDHSVNFWATVGTLYGPGYENARRWLSQHGAELHRYF